MQPSYINEQRTIEGFFNAYENAEVTIAFRTHFMARERIGREANFMPIVDHPEGRVVLKPGEIAKIHAKHPDENKQFLNNLILVMGTPYGVVVFHATEKNFARAKNGKVNGVLPHMHTTINFTKMAMRVFKRKGWRGFLGDFDMKNWVFSPTFQADMDEQVAIDRQAELERSRLHYEETGEGKSFAGTIVTDGLPPRRRAQHPTTKSTQPRLTSHDVKEKNPFFKKSDVAPPRRQPGLHAGGYPAD
jgi:hypothetical protein